MSSIDEINNMTKEDLIHKILENSVYMPEAGMRERLSKSLLKLSKSDLFNLELLIEIRISDAKR